MNPAEWTLVGFALLFSSGLSWILGLIGGARLHRWNRDRAESSVESPDLSVRVARLEPAENVARTSTDGRWRDEDGYHDLREVRGRGTDENVDALERVRESDENERVASNRGFRGEDLSDREVNEWLERFGL